MRMAWNFDKLETDKASFFGVLEKRDGRWAVDANKYTSLSKLCLVGQVFVYLPPLQQWIWYYWKLVDLEGIFLSSICRAHYVRNVSSQGKRVNWLRRFDGVKMTCSMGASSLSGIRKGQLQPNSTGILHLCLCNNPGPDLILQDDNAGCHRLNQGCYKKLTLERGRRENGVACQQSRPQPPPNTWGISLNVPFRARVTNVTNVANLRQILAEGWDAIHSIQHSLPQNYTNQCRQQQEKFEVWNIFLWNSPSSQWWCSYSKCMTLKNGILFETDEMKLSNSATLNKKHI